MKRTILAAILTVILAASTEPQGTPACVAVEFTLHAYSGPIHIDNACLTAMTHTGDRTVIEARDLGDGIFRGDFEVWP